MTGLDRYRGVMAGVLRGDSLGAPYETRTNDLIQKDFDKRGGLAFHDYRNPWLDTYPSGSTVGNLLTKELITFAGKPTDDTEQTAILAMSIIANKGMNQSDLYSRLRHNVIDKASIFGSWKCLASGNNTRQSLKPYTFELSKVELETKPIRATNGSLMRASPLALINLSEESMLQSISVTHRAEESIQATLVYVSIMKSLLKGGDILSACKNAIKTSYFSELNQILSDPVSGPEKYLSFSQGAGHPFYSLKVSLWSVSKSSSYKEGILTL